MYTDEKPSKRKFNAAVIAHIKERVSSDKEVTLDSDITKDGLNIDNLDRNEIESELEEEFDCKFDIPHDSWTGNGDIDKQATTVKEFSDVLYDHMKMNDTNVLSSTERFSSYTQTIGSVKLALFGKQFDVKVGFNLLNCEDELHDGMISAYNSIVKKPEQIIRTAINKTPKDAFTDWDGAPTWTFENVSKSLTPKAITLCCYKSNKENKLFGYTVLSGDWTFDPEHGFGIAVQGGTVFRIFPEMTAIDHHFY